MTNLELEVILAEEKYNELKKDWELSDAKLRIRELEWQVANPDYHDDGWKIPMTDWVKMENNEIEQMQITTTINDIEHITGFFQGIAVSTFMWWAGILTLLFIAVA